MDKITDIQINLWDKYPVGHWLRNYGKTEVIFIDDEIHAEEPLMIPDENIDSLTQRLNIEFYYFTKDSNEKWDESWFKVEFDKMRQICKKPAIIFLDLMFGSKQKNPHDGSGITFLNIIRSDPSFVDVPIIIHTAGKQNDPLVMKLKDSGSCQYFLEKCYNADKLEKIILEYALLSDPNIHAYSKAMRIVAQQLRKIVLAEELKEVIIDKKTEIPLTTLLVGRSGDGKDYLAHHLIKMSSRKDSYDEMDFSTSENRENGVVRLFGSLPYTQHAGYYYRLNIETGKIEGPPIIGLPKGKDLKSNLAVLTNVGMATKFGDGGALILNELGNAPEDLKKILLTFIERRVVQPKNYSGFVPSKGYYDLWLVITMQPKNSFEDLGTRIDTMQRINIPSLERRREDIIPLAAFFLDSEMIKPPEKLFRPEALDWLEDMASNWSVRSLKGFVRKLKSVSTLGHYNVMELERAYNKCKEDSFGDELISFHRSASELSKSIGNESADSMPVIDHSLREPELSFFALSPKDRVKRLIEILEKTKKSSLERPDYRDAWDILTGIKNDLTPTQRHREVGKVFFDITDREIVQLIQENKSKIILYALIQCGRKVDEKRLKNILECEDLSSDPSLSSMIKEINDRVNKEIAKHKKGK